MAGLTPVSDDELIEVIRRFSLEEEDVGMMADDEEWSMFVEAKLDAAGQHMSDAQWDWLQKSREPSYKAVGFRYEAPGEWHPDRPIYRIAPGLPGAGQFMARESALYSLEAFRRG